jgi:hypothetical protein
MLLANATTINPRKGEGSMLRKIMVLGLVAVSMIVLAAFDAHGYWINGHYVAKGVECKGESVVQNIDKNWVSLACWVESATDVIVVCQNPGGNISKGEAFISDISFNEGLSTATISPDKKGKVTFDTVASAAGINPPQNSNCALGDAYCNCSYDAACSKLRAYCPNDNWLPIDVTPVKMVATVAEYFCDNDYNANGDHIHMCACDPSKTDPNDSFACATATGNGRYPWSYNWSGYPVPAAFETSYCELPDPDTWQYGESRQYNCCTPLPCKP